MRVKTKFDVGDEVYAYVATGFNSETHLVIRQTIKSVHVRWGVNTPEPIITYYFEWEAAPERCVARSYDELISAEKGLPDEAPL